MRRKPTNHNVLSARIESILAEMPAASPETIRAKVNASLGPDQRRVQLRTIQDHLRYRAV